MVLDRVTSLARAGKMSRRDFVQLLLAAGVTAATAEGLFIAATRAEAKQGGSLKMAIGHGATTDTLDPATLANTFTADLANGVYGGTLVEIDQKTQALPNLAESFEPADGATRWVFKLRQGLTFHNGKSVTPADVIESFNYHRAESSKSAAKSLLSSVTDIKPDGPDSIVFILSSGSADFPYIASDYHFQILPAKDGGGIDWERQVGTGPFMIESFEPGIRARAKRNPNYHKSGLPHFDEIELLSVLDVTARTNALIAGDVHYIDRVDLKTIDLLKQNPDLAITNVTGFAHYIAPIDVTAAPFDSVDVRLALKWAIDRDEILEKVLFGYGKAGNDNPIAPSVKFATEPQPAFSYDPDKAKFHLKKAGFETLKIDFSASDAAFAGAVDAALLMQQQARAAGIDINVIREPADTYWDNVWLKKPWCMSYWGGRPTCDWMFTTAYAEGAAWNETKWKQPRFNELLVKARAETDDVKRAAMYAEMQQLVHDDCGAIILMFNNYVCAHSKLIAHGDLNANYDHDGSYIFERWWFA
jgi:peptide/nickel transport system substrate-binding protein